MEQGVRCGGLTPAATPQPPKIRPEMSKLQLRDIRATGVRDMDLETPGPSQHADPYVVFEVLVGSSVFSSARTRHVANTVANAVWDDKLTLALPDPDDPALKRAVSLAPPHERAHLKSHTRLRCKLLDMDFNGNDEAICTAEVELRGTRGLIKKSLARRASRSRAGTTKIDFSWAIKRWADANADTEEEVAATKVQAARRGSVARRNTAALNERAEQAVAAATKVQAARRGSVARRRVGPRQDGAKPEDLDAAAAKVQVARSGLAALGGGHGAASGRGAAAAPKAAASAVVRVQAVHRGRSSRRHVHQLPTHLLQHLQHRLRLLPSRIQQERVVAARKLQARQRRRAAVAGAEVAEASTGATPRAAGERASADAKRAAGAKTPTTAARSAPPRGRTPNAGGASHEEAEGSGSKADAQGALNVWSSQELLIRSSKFSSQFVRSALALEGKLLLGIEGAQLAPAVCAAWSTPVQLYCAASIVDSRGAAVPGATERRTASLRVQPGQARRHHPRHHPSPWPPPLAACSSRPTAPPSYHRRRPCHRRR